MQIFRFELEKSQIMDKYDSRLVKYLPLGQISEGCNLGYLCLEAQGIVGYHLAPVPQLFLVVQGEGWIRAEDDTRISIQQGDAVFWEKGEGHETGSHKGMLALVIQSPSLELTTPVI